MKLFFLVLLFLSVEILNAKTISVMSYNLENLFDSKHDEDKNDWEFLPKGAAGKSEFCAKENSRKKREECLNSDWNPEKLKIKMELLSSVIKAKNPELPDVLGVIEVENQDVLSQFGAVLGYQKFEITNSPDKRGIDVALLYKESEGFKKIHMKEHQVFLDYPTRNILEVRFLVNSKYYLTLFVNHWPSLHNPDSTRISAATVLKKRIDEILKENAEERILAMGDFNTIDSCNPHPFKTVLQTDDKILDIHSEVKNSPLVDDKIKADMKSGTYYFPPKDEWNLLDRFFISKNLLNNDEAFVNLKTYEIFSAPFMLFDYKKKLDHDNEKGMKIVMVPKKFKPYESDKDKMGFSDHFPIFVQLDFKDPAPIVEKAKPKKKKKK